MNNERLLSENEITLIVGWPSAFEYAKIIEITTAQDRKSIAARDKWWIENISKAWDEYVVYPITIDQKKSEGCTRVTFNRKPEFPEFISKWQSPQAIFGDE